VLELPWWTSATVTAVEPVRCSGCSEWARGRKEERASEPQNGGLSACVGAAGQLARTNQGRSDARLGHGGVVKLRGREHRASNDR
jgi:hypothetical protein